MHHSRTIQEMGKRKASQAVDPPPPPVDASDDDAPEEVTSSKAPAGFEEAAAAAVVPAPTKKRERRTRVRAREERYWAEKGKNKGEVQESEEGPAVDDEAGAEDGEGGDALQAAAAVPGGVVLSARLLERVARAKEAERARKVHEALAVVEMARRRELAQQRKLKISQPKAPRVFGNIEVAPLGVLEQEDDREVPSEVLAFARSNGEQGRRKRVPFTSFAQQKAVVGARPRRANAGGRRRR